MPFLLTIQFQKRFQFHSVPTKFRNLHTRQSPENIWTADTCYAFSRSPYFERSPFEFFLTLPEAKFGELNISMTDSRRFLWHI